MIKNVVIQLGFILFTVFILVLLLTRLSGQTVKFLSHAVLQKADIRIDAQDSQGPLVRVWQGLSQGGETETDGKIMSLGPTGTLVKNLTPKYIRIDHIFDTPSDARLKEIVSLGATPFVSLSYFPRDVSNSDTGEVTNWSAWQNHVTGLVEKLSGKNGQNLNNVYYEVWNEPDGPGFGNFSVGQGKDYFTLYSKTVEAIQNAQNVNPLKIGGPAMADPRRCSNGLLFVCQQFWLDSFLEKVTETNTRLDFISWHRYSQKISDFSDDVNFINSTTLKYPTLPKVEKIITEWGSKPERDPVHNSIIDASHLVASTSLFASTVDLSTKFEVRDGPSDPKGGWGILTFDGKKKPTYVAMQYLNLLRSDRVNINGEGNHVVGIASKDNSGFTLILTNYDSSSSNIEKVPIEIDNLVVGLYRINKYVIDERTPLGSNISEDLHVFDGRVLINELMLPNSVVVWDLQLIGI